LRTDERGKTGIMQVLERHGRAPFRLRPWILVVAALAIVGLVIVITNGGGKSNHPHGSAAGASAGSRTGGGGTPLIMTSSTPGAGAQGVASNTDITVNFSEPVTLGKVLPTLSPAVAGTWAVSGSKSLVYDLDAPLVPSTQEVVTIPGGPTGLKATDGRTLAASTSFHFNVATSDTLRLQELLSELNYLPFIFTPSGKPPAPKDLALDQTGTLAWKWPGLPTQLTELWAQGASNIITTAAVESFENQNNLTVDGVAGPKVWSALLHDIGTNTMNANPYVYVLVNKVQPENLTLYNNGTPQYSGILVNTGASGADTADGTYAVFEHVRYSDMKGTNPDGTTYNDPNVPYASYFNGGDALHGFIRASYGFPQSNGCVEMAYANAALIWPLTPIGTLVTVEGPASPPLPTTTTTTTTTVPPTTTTAPPATTTPPPPPATTPTT
jgi:peptidoglycan hydrolase-like protein with peptidoglycan-binding domain